MHPSKNINNFFPYVSLALLFFGAAACSQTDIEQPEVSTTAVGAATGAAVGAGLGAIIGSATGNAGEGVAIGAVAGAATGGVVGNQFQQQEELLANQEEQILRQEQQIQEHRRELEQLQRDGAERQDSKRVARLPSLQVSDVPSSSRPQEQRASLPAAPGNPGVFEPEAVEPAPGNSLAGGFKIPAKNAPSVSKNTRSGYSTEMVSRTELGSQQSQARAEERAELRREARARMSDPSPTTGVNSSMNTSTGTLPVASLPVEEDIPLKEEVQAEPASSSDDWRASEEASDALPPAASYVSESPDQKETEAKTAKKTAAKTIEASTQRKEIAAKCSSGESEAVRARNATSDADRLFYYKRAIRLCPNEPAYHVEIGRVYSSIGKTSQARESFHKALELDPENEIAQDELSMIMLDNSY